MTDLAALLPRLDAPTRLPLGRKNVRDACCSAVASALKPLRHPPRAALRDLLKIDVQKQRVDTSTRRFARDGTGRQ